jgi:RimJ/RimL family protein N-acetyltransferase
VWDVVPLLYEIGIDPIACELAGVKPRTREAFITRWKDVLADPAINCQVIQIITPSPDSAAATPEFAGSVTVFQAPGETRNSIGYWLAREHWGKGIASRALCMFLQIEPRRPLHATASMTNLASHRILLKNGFRLVRQYLSPESDRLLARQTGEFILE